MDRETKEYLDQKFDALEKQRTNPDFDALREQSKQFAKRYQSYYLKWVIAGAVLCLLTMFITFRLVGLI